MSKKDIVINTASLGEAMIAKRTGDNLGLREAAEKCGLSVNNFWRAEAGNVPKADAFALICIWLKMPMESFINKSLLNGKKNTH